MDYQANAMNKKQRAWSFLKDGQYDMAKSLSSELCKLNRRDPESWYLLALAQSHLGKYPDAIKSYRKTLELTPDQVEVTFNLALTFQMCGRLDDAIQYYRKSIGLNPLLHDAHYNLGNILFTLGRYEKAEECYREVIRQQPDHVDAKINLGVVLQRKLDFDSAECLLQSVANNYNSPVAYLNLGQLYQTRNENKHACSCYLKSLELNPDLYAAWLNLGKLYESMGQYNRAMNAYNNVLAKTPDNIDALHGNATVCFQAGHFQKAREFAEKTLTHDRRHLQSYIIIASLKAVNGDYSGAFEDIDRAIGINSAYTDAIVLKAKIYEQMGEEKSAMELLEPLLHAGTACAAAGSLFANICTARKQYHEAIAYLESMLENNAYPNWGLRQIHFSLGKLYDSAGSYDRAFSHYQKGNTLRICDYDPVHHSRYIDGLIKMFPPNYDHIFSRSMCRSFKPLFIVGMPRSGTSLIEQILSCHPKIAAGGEMTFIPDTAYALGNRLCAETPYPECLPFLTSEVSDSIAQEFIEITSTIRKHKSLVTDKLPGNFLHLGLISLLFPSAKIIHCRRSPRDTCLSCYFQDFSGDHPYSYNLEHLAHYYHEYHRLMDHWQRVLKIPILTMRYESLIENQEFESRRLLEFCELEWEPRCLHFNEAKRFVRTASYDQVRHPIYKKSMHRWKHYEAYLGPLRDLPAE